MSIAHTTDYETAGPALLIERYRKPIIVSLLASWLAEVQEAEDAFWHLLSDRSVSNAQGASLDVQGRIVGQPREGRTDENYRVWVAARILVQRSSGTPEQLIAIAKKLLGDAVPIWLEETYPAALIVHAEAAIEATVGSQVAQLLVAAKPAGVALQFVWFAAGPNQPFTFASGAASEFDSPMGFDNGALAAVSSGSAVEFLAPDVPSNALVDDSDGQPLVFDGDNDFLTLG